MTMENDEDIQKRSVPQSDLDYNLMTTNPVWGDPQINAELRAKLSQIRQEKNEQGESEIKKENLWSLLNFYSRDMRLANLSREEILYIQYYLDLAGDLLQSDMVRSFLICLSRAATVLELSQSKHGFLRRRMNTFTQEQFKTEMEPPRKKLFGGKSQEPGV